jgi:hypothetical protein
MSDVFKKLPSSVRIGCYSFSVEIMNGDDANIAGVYGAMMSFGHKIRLNPLMSAQQAANTFIHEVLHAIHLVYGLSDGSDEETFTSLSANGLCAFWQDNTEACKWWINSLAEVKK